MALYRYVTVISLWRWQLLPAGKSRNALTDETEAPKPRGIANIS